MPLDFVLVSAVLIKATAIQTYNIIWKYFTYKTVEVHENTQVGEVKEGGDDQAEDSGAQQSMTQEGEVSTAEVGAVSTEQDGDSQQVEAVTSDNEQQMSEAQRRIFLQQTLRPAPGKIVIKTLEYFE